MMFHSCSCCWRLDLASLQLIQRLQHSTFPPLNIRTIQFTIKSTSSTVSSTSHQQSSSPPPLSRRPSQWLLALVGACRCQCLQVSVSSPDNCPCPRLQSSQFQQLAGQTHRLVINWPVPRSSPSLPGGRVSSQSHPLVCLPINIGSEGRAASTDSCVCQIKQCMTSRRLL